MNKNKLTYAIKSSFVGLIAGVSVQYIIEVVLKLLKTIMATFLNILQIKKSL